MGYRVGGLRRGREGVFFFLRSAHTEGYCIFHLILDCDGFHLWCDVICFACSYGLKKSYSEKCFRDIWHMNRLNCNQQHVRATSRKDVNRVNEELPLYRQEENRASNEPELVAAPEMSSKPTTAKAKESFTPMKCIREGALSCSPKIDKLSKNFSKSAKSCCMALGGRGPDSCATSMRDVVPSTSCVEAEPVPQLPITLLEQVEEDEDEPGESAEIGAAFVADSSAKKQDVPSLSESELVSLTAITLSKQSDLDRTEISPEIEASVLPDHSAEEQSAVSQSSQTGLSVSSPHETISYADIQLLVQKTRHELPQPSVSTNVAMKLQTVSPSPLVVVSDLSMPSAISASFCPGTTQVIVGMFSSSASIGGNSLLVERSWALCGHSNATTYFCFRFFILHQEKQYFARGYLIILAREGTITSVSVFVKVWRCSTSTCSNEWMSATATNFERVPSPVVAGCILAECRGHPEALTEPTVNVVTHSMKSVCPSTSSAQAINVVRNMILGFQKCAAGPIAIQNIPRRSLALVGTNMSREANYPHVEDGLPPFGRVPSRPCHQKISKQGDIPMNSTFEFVHERDGSSTFQIPMPKSHPSTTRHTCGPSTFAVLFKSIVQSLPCLPTGPPESMQNAGPSASSEYPVPSVRHTASCVTDLQNLPCQQNIPVQSPSLQNDGPCAAVTIVTGDVVLNSHSANVIFTACCSRLYLTYGGSDQKGDFAVVSQNLLQSLSNGVPCMSPMHCFQQIPDLYSHSVRFCGKMVEDVTIRVKMWVISFAGRRHFICSKREPSMLEVHVRKQQAVWQAKLCFAFTNSCKATRLLVVASNTRQFSASSSPACGFVSSTRPYQAEVSRRVATSSKVVRGNQIGKLSAVAQEYGTGQLKITPKPADLHQFLLSQPQLPPFVSLQVDLTGEGDGRVEATPEKLKCQVPTVHKTCYNVKEVVRLIEKHVGQAAKVDSSATDMIYVSCKPCATVGQPLQGIKGREEAGQFPGDVVVEAVKCDQPARERGVGKVDETSDCLSATDQDLMRTCRQNQNGAQHMEDGEVGVATNRGNRPLQGCRPAVPAPGALLLTLFFRLLPSVDCSSGGSNPTGSILFNDILLFLMHYLGNQYVIAGLAAIIVFLFALLIFIFCVWNCTDRNNGGPVDRVVRPQYNNGCPIDQVVRPQHNNGCPVGQVVRPHEEVVQQPSLESAISFAAPSGAVNFPIQCSDSQTPVQEDSSSTVATSDLKLSSSGFLYCNGGPPQIQLCVDGLSSTSELIQVECGLTVHPNITEVDRRKAADGSNEESQHQLAQNQSGAHLFAAPFSKQNSLFENSIASCGSGSVLVCGSENNWSAVPSCVSPYCDRVSASSLDSDTLLSTACASDSIDCYDPSTSTLVGLCITRHRRSRRQLDSSSSNSSPENEDALNVTGGADQTADDLQCMGDVNVLCDNLNARNCNAEGNFDEPLVFVGLDSPLQMHDSDDDPALPSGDHQQEQDRSIFDLVLKPFFQQYGESDDC